MQLEYRRRVNLHGHRLGKTFHLDAAWWSLTGRWLHAVNPKLTVGFPARPTDVETVAKIETRVRWSAAPPRTLRPLGRVSKRWTRNHLVGASLVLYAHSDGSVSVWDPARNHPGGDERHPTDGGKHTNASDDDPASIPWTRRRGKVKPVDSPG